MYSTSVKRQLRIRLTEGIVSEFGPDYEFSYEDLRYNYFKQRLEISNVNLSLFDLRTLKIDHIVFNGKLSMIKAALGSDSIDHLDHEFELIAQGINLIETPQSIHESVEIGHLHIDGEHLSHLTHPIENLVMPPLRLNATCSDLLYVRKNALMPESILHIGLAVDYIEHAFESNSMGTNALLTMNGVEYLQFSSDSPDTTRISFRSFDSQRNEEQVDTISSILPISTIPDALHLFPQVLFPNRGYYTANYEVEELNVQIPPDYEDDFYWVSFFNPIEDMNIFGVHRIEDSIFHANNTLSAPSLGNYQVEFQAPIPEHQDMMFSIDAFHEELELDFLGQYIQPVQLHNLAQLNLAFESADNHTLEYHGTTTWGTFGEIYTMIGLRDSL